MPITLSNIWFSEYKQYRPWFLNNSSSLCDYKDVANDQASILKSVCKQQKEAAIQNLNFMCHNQKWANNSLFINILSVLLCLQDDHELQAVLLI